MLFHYFDNCMYNGIRIFHMNLFANLTTFIMNSN